MSQADSTRFLLEIALLLAAGLSFGHLARRVRLPAVVGELFGGVLLGPTLLGRVSPSLLAWLFPTSGPVATAREGVLKLALLTFLFVAGLEVNLAHVRRHKATVLWTSLLGIALPFACGYFAVRWFSSMWRQPAAPDQTALFLGAALSITALPVIARILIDLQLERTPFASIVLAAATIDDITGWTLFATVLTAVTREAGPLDRWSAVAVVLALTALVVTVGRRAIDWSRRHFGPHASNPGSLIAAAGVLTIVLAAILEKLGLHAMFGAFLAGLAMARGLEERAPAHEIVHQFGLGVLAPIYFVSIGLRADFVGSFDLLLVLIVLAIACVGKIVGATAGAWIGRLPRREALAVGFAMNARGAVEIVVASVALEAHVIDARLFVALVLMALATSVISGPAIRALLPPDAQHPSRAPGSARLPPESSAGRCSG
jgi:Kef-type K+ transport system membrane component KefB